LLFTSDILEKLSASITIIDLKISFFLIKMHSESVHLTSATELRRSFLYNRMITDLNKSLLTFIKVTELEIRGLSRDEMKIYLEDTGIFANFQRAYLKTRESMKKIPMSQTRSQDTRIHS
jgi:hypothetical protein